MLQNSAPEPTSTTPRLVIRLNGVVHSLVPLPERFCNPNSDVNTIEATKNTTNTITGVESNSNSDDNGNEEEEDGLLDEVDREYDRGGSVDAEDGPDWMFEADEVTSKDPNYVFCPAPHRKQLLHLFTKHFCQHPLFAERDGKWTKDKIRLEAVHDMYRFCYTRGLREVWGYMWECWYSPKMWCLWARSTSPYISRLRTTMNVENFWRQLKHDYLYRIARPRLDHLVWVLIHKVTPAYIARAEILNDSHRLGRPKQLTTYQKYFKASWKKLSESHISDKVYETNIKDWTCTCGRQKYDRHHLCKHLVKAVAPPSKRFWREVVRRRTLPIYRHSELRTKDGMQLEELASDDGTTDGDDHIWSGDRDILKGGGGWRDLEQQASQPPSVLGKRAHHGQDGHFGDDQGSTQGQTKRARTSEVIDLTQSSPAPEDAKVVEMLVDHQSSSPIDYGSGDEHDVSPAIDMSVSSELTMFQFSNRLICIRKSSSEKLMLLKRQHKCCAARSHTGTMFG